MLVVISVLAAVIAVFAAVPSARDDIVLFLDTYILIPIGTSWDAFATTVTSNPYVQSYGIPIGVVGGLSLALLIKKLWPRIRRKPPVVKPYMGAPLVAPPQMITPPTTGTPITTPTEEKKETTA